MFITTILTSSSSGGGGGGGSDSSIAAALLPYDDQDDDHHHVVIVVVSAIIRHGACRCMRPVADSRLNRGWEGQVVVLVAGVYRTDVQQTCLDMVAVAGNGWCVAVVLDRPGLWR